jgi:O-antigen/teichoic acid export membrane protein
MMTDVQRLFRTGVLHVLVVLAGTRAMAIIRQLVLVRLVSQEDMGGIIFVMRIVQLLLTVAGLGMGTAVLKYCSEPVDEQRIHRRYRTGLTFAGVTSLVAAAAYAVGVLATNSYGGGTALTGPMLVLAIYVPAQTLQMLGAAYLQARKRIKKASKITLVIQTCMLAATIGAVTVIGAWGYYLGLVVGALVAAGVFLYVTREGFRHARLDWSQVGAMVNMGFFSILANFTGVANATASVMLLKWLSGDLKAVAVFGIASYFMILVRMLPMSLRRTALPYLSGSLHDPERLKARINELILKQFPAMLAIIVLIGTAGYWLIPFVLGPEYAASYLPTMLLLVGTLIWALVFPYGLLMIICNQVRLNFMIGVLQLAVSVGLGIVLIPSYGAVGAAAAVAASMAVVVPPKWFFAKRALAKLSKTVPQSAETTRDTETVQ